MSLFCDPLPTDPRVASMGVSGKKRMHSVQIKEINLATVLGRHKGKCTVWHNRLLCPLEHARLDHGGRTVETPTDKLTRQRTAKNLVPNLEAILKSINLQAGAFAAIELDRGDCSDFHVQSAIRVQKKSNNRPAMPSRPAPVYIVPIIESRAGYTAYLRVDGLYTVARLPSDMST